MKASYKLAEPAKAEATLTLTMSVAEWTALQAVLRAAGSGYPQWKVCGLIGDLVAKAHAAFYATGDLDS